MSDIYVTEPPPSGRVVLETSRGDIEIELFAKECPKACKSFIALALEGYYDNLIWHRYLADFIIQSGDPSGTGAGGESFYGEPFRDEIHSRLRFNRRGLLGMANGSERDTNESQFFLTLAPTPELQGRHTMFGRVVSNKTIYNLVALAESVGEVDENDRPKFPPKLKTVRVIENPFEGEIQLRITRQERLDIQKNKRDAEKRKLEREREAAQSQRKKNTTLLSFGEEEDVRGGAALKGPKSSHDLLTNDRRLLSTQGAEKLTTQQARPEPDKDSDKLKHLGRLASQTDTSREEAGSSRVDSVMDLSSKKIASPDPIGNSTQNGVKKEKKTGKGRALLEQFRSAYRDPSDSSSKKRAAARDEQTALLLQTFQKRMRNSTSLAKEAEISPARSNDKNLSPLHGQAEEVPADLREYGESDGDEDASDWRSHKFDFGGKSVLQDKHADDEYVTLDPRDSSGSAARQLGFGTREAVDNGRYEQRRQMGRRGRDWVDERSHRAYGGTMEESSRNYDERRQDDWQRRSHRPHDQDTERRRRKSPPIPSRRDDERW